jgi:hypothetical protein
VTEEQAQKWLEQVEGAVYRNESPFDEHESWVAVVQTPQAGATQGQIIMAYGESIASATIAAEQQWNRLWGQLSSVH